MNVEGAGDVVQLQKQPFQIDKLPYPALRHLFKFLSWKDQKYMRVLCKGLQRFVEREYGVHAYFPPRYSHSPQMSTLHPGRMCLTLVTDTRALRALEGKVVRSLEMSEMHPDFTPSPMGRSIRWARGLMRVSLKYVDVGLLASLLASCNNLLELHYTTGVQNLRRPQPVPIPMGGEQLIEFITQLPHLSFQMDNLSFLSLRLETVDPEHHSDWANVLFILLALSQRSLGSLKTFKFAFAADAFFNSRDLEEVLACVGQFLSQCPNLRELEYSCEMWTERSGCAALPQAVFSGLIEKYGSALLKEMHVAGGLGLRDMSLRNRIIRQIMRGAGMNLRNLQDVHFRWCNQVEAELFQILLSALPSPSIRKIGVWDEIGQSFTNGNYDLLLGQRESQPALPFYGNLEKLCVYRPDSCFSLIAEDDDPNGALSLPRMLDTMRSLTHLEFVPRESNVISGQGRGVAPRYYRYEDRNDFGTVDVTFEDVADVHFEALKVLRLEGVKMSQMDAGRLTKLRNLEVLVLQVIPEHRHQLFGMKSEDLITLVGKLRKLKVNMIQFPQDDKLKSEQRAVLEGIGKLDQMHRIVGDLEDADVGWMRHEHDYETEPIGEYFTFESGRDANDD